jgi:hypothetical protein
VDTIEGAWARLDSRYASPATVGSNLINGFIESKLTAKNNSRKMMELEEAMMTLFHDLRTVKQEEQVTQNTYLLQQTVLKIPKEYQARYAAVSMEEENLLGQTQWSIFTEFLTVQREMLERHTPLVLEENTEEEVTEMIGETTLEEGNYCYSGFVSRILWLIGLAPKELVRSACKFPGP